MCRMLCHHRREELRAAGDAGGTNAHARVAAGASRRVPVLLHGLLLGTPSGDAGLRARVSQGLASEAHLERAPGTAIIAN